MQYAPPMLAAQPANGLTCGIDWARDDHAIAIVDSHGRQVLRNTIEHSAAGLRELLAVLARTGAAEVAIERPDGPVVDALLGAGITVVVISPNQLKNLRSRYGSAGNKDDRFDAFVLADTLRTDRARLRPLVPDSPATAALRATCRARKDLVSHRVAVANQLREHLKRVFPGAVGLFADLDSAISLTFLTRFDCQDRADWLTPTRLGAWLDSVGYPGRTDPGTLHARLTAAPRGATGTRGPPTPISPAPWWPPSPLSSNKSPLSPSRSVSNSPATPTRTSSPACLVLEPSALQGFWPKSGTAAPDSPPPKHWRAWPAWHRRPASRERCARSASAGPATNNYATPSATSPTIPATPTPGPPTSTTAPSPAAHDHPHAVRILARAWLYVIWHCWQTNTAYNPGNHRALQALLNQQQSPAA